LVSVFTCPFSPQLNKGLDGAIINYFPSSPPFAIAPARSFLVLRAGRPGACLSQAPGAGPYPGLYPALLLRTRGGMNSGPIGAMHCQDRGGPSLE